MVHLDFASTEIIWLIALAGAMGIFFLNWEKRNKWYLYTALAIFAAVFALILFLIRDYTLA